MEGAWERLVEKMVSKGEWVEHTRTRFFPVCVIPLHAVARYRDPKLAASTTLLNWKLIKNHREDSK